MVRSYTPTLYSTSALVPTTLLSPQVIEPTVYVETPLVYQSTGYRVEVRRPGLFERLFGGMGRRTVEYDVIPTTYVESIPAVVPTTTLSATRYVLPTTIVEGPVIEVDPCVVPSASERVVSQGTSADPPRGAAPRPYEGTGAGATGEGRADGTREPAFDYGSTGATKPADASDAESTAPPVVEPAPPPLDGATSRSAYRPVATEMRPQDAGASIGALRGIVVNANGQPKPDIRVVFTDARQTYRDRERTTDAEGRFEVVLPNGDWVVNVQESDGRLTPFGTITSAGGRFYDERDRIVSSLRLNH
jgi:hypothetical protein